MADKPTRAPATAKGEHTAKIFVTKSRRVRMELAGPGLLTTSTTMTPAVARELAFHLLNTASEAESPK